VIEKRPSFRPFRSGMSRTRIRPGPQRAVLVAKWVSDAKRKPIFPLLFALGILLGGCSGDGPEPSSHLSTTSGPTESSDTSHGPSSSTIRHTVATVQKLPWIGEVVISRSAERGIVIRDRTTAGSSFFLSDELAGECLSFLEANPGASRQAVESACPGKRP
jgi:hypothetical protein